MDLTKICCISNCVKSTKLWSFKFILLSFCYYSQSSH